MKNLAALSRALVAPIAAQSRKRSIAMFVLLVAGATILVILLPWFTGGVGKSKNSGGYQAIGVGALKVLPPGASVLGSPELPVSVGMSPSPTWTLLGSSPDNLYVSQSESVTTSSAGISGSIGLLGSLYELWVPTAAVAMYGNLSNGLQLPLPLSFSTQDPGPNEVVVQIFEFGSSAEAQSIFSSPDLNVGSAARSPDGFTPIVGQAVGGGVAASYRSDSLGAYNDYEFQWTSGAYWIQVGVVGYHETIAQAAAIAGTVSP